MDAGVCIENLEFVIYFEKVLTLFVRVIIVFHLAWHLNEFPVYSIRFLGLSQKPVIH